MHTIKMSGAEFVAEYGGACRRLYPWRGVVSPPFGSMWTRLPPAGRTDGHGHHEAETFVIMSGRGAVRIDDESQEVEAGDVVYAPPYSHHTVVNTSGDDDLLFLAVYWEDFDLVRDAAPRSAAAGPPLLVTITPPTVNGDLHLGHLAGPYLAADAYARHQRMRGRRVRLITGADVHQSYVVRAAKSRREMPTDTARAFTAAIRKSLAAARVEIDHFGDPAREPEHAFAAQTFFTELIERSALLRRSAEVLYCEVCRRELFEAHVSGRCPHCGESSDGNACEACARPNDCIDLIDPRCRGCDCQPITRSLDRWEFPMARYADELRAWLAAASMPPRLRALYEAMIDDGLPDVAITHHTDWGIPVPTAAGALPTDERLYVWFEMCPGYVSAADAAFHGSGWRGADRAEMVQFFGFDNAYFHGLLFPALSIAHGDHPLPDAFVTNEFYRLEGSKFSTSRGHAVWASEFLAREPLDRVRFFLALDRPEDAQTSFSEDAYRRATDDLFARRLAPWLREVFAALDREYDGTTPATGSYTSAHRARLASIHRALDEYGECFDADTFSLARAARRLGSFVDDAAAFARGERALAGCSRHADARRTAVALDLLAVRSFAMMAEPLMPNLARRLRRALGLADWPERWDPSPSFVPAGQRSPGLAALDGMERQSVSS